jgi:dipeptidyl aminopeptidase/acylaminoacyl peptidase
MAERKPYGTWPSPISAAMVAKASRALDAPTADETGLYWLESRPEEQGRSVIVRLSRDGAHEDVTPAMFNVRTRVHEYGGGAYHVIDGTVYFANFADQGLYRQRPGEEPLRINPSDGLRYADCDSHGRHLFCVREDHRAPGQPRNTLVRVDLDAPHSDGEVVFEGSDFVAYPRVDASGRRIAFIAWDFPNMPWDDVALWVAGIGADGGFVEPRRINTGVAESILQPAWAEDGTLYFISDRGEGWWNLHRFDGRAVEPVLSMRADFGGPLWNLGVNFFALLSSREAIVRYSDEQGQHLAKLDLGSGKLKTFDLPFSAFGSIAARDGRVYVVAMPLDAPSELIALDAKTGAHSTLATSGARPFAAGYVSRPQAIEFPTDGGLTAFAYHYPPANPECSPEPGSRPPLVVEVHGGPTAATVPAYSVSRHFWTSRGFAVLDVNYGGSTGHGRAFRERLYGQWGVVDLRDTINAARYAVERGLADPNRLIIHGGSAGGYLVLAALALDDTFAAGASYFGVSDLEALAGETHKFEARYLDKLVGPYPEMRDVYVERSPIHHLDKFGKPLILLQGLDDRVVPPNQSERIYEALRAKHVPVALLTFEGEGHGFRSAESRTRALEAELYFYGRVLDFEPAGRLAAVPIANLDRASIRRRRRR